MAIVELVMPKMGESIMEATILRWHKKAGDHVNLDETVLEIATDKVDSEVPAIAEGTIAELLFNENDVVPVGAVIARINTDADVEVDTVEEPVAPVASEPRFTTAPAYTPAPPAEAEAPAGGGGPGQAEAEAAAPTGQACPHRSQLPRTARRGPAGNRRLARGAAEGRPDPRGAALRRRARPQPARRVEGRAR